MKKLSWSVLIFILIVVINLIRFWNFPEWYIFDADQETLSLMVKQIVVDHKPLLIGMPTSVGGMFIGPLLVYLLAPFYQLGSMSPWSNFLFVLLGSLATTASIYFVSSKIFSKSTGVYATVIYGLSFLITSFDRTFWNPTLMPLASIWMFYGLWRYLNDRKTIWLVLSVMAVGFMANFHFTFVFGLGFLFISWLLFSRNFRILLLMGLIFFIFVSPLVIFDLRHDLFITRNFLSFLSSGPEKTSNIVQSFSLLEKAMVYFSVLKATLYNHASIILDLIVAFGLLVYSAIAVIRKNLGNKLILIAMGVSLAVMLVNRGPFLPYYLNFVFPLWSFVLAQGLSKLNFKYAFLPIGVVVVMAAVNVPAILNSRTNLSLKYKKAIADYIAADARGSTFKVDFIHQPGLKTGFNYLFWQATKTDLVSDVSVNTEKTYKIILPHSLVPESELAASFGGVGVVKVPSQLQPALAE